MKKIKVSKAGSIGENPIAGCIIEISVCREKMFNDYLIPLEEKENIFETDAENIFKALSKNLPGGTLIRLVSKFLQEEAKRSVSVIGRYGSNKS